MARIRTIKPETLDDERPAALSDSAWRLWVSMWLLADDCGNCRANVEYLRGQIWWAHERPPAIDRLLDELAAADSIVRYTVRHQQYAHVERWEKHQRIDNAGTPKVPGIEESNDSRSPRDVRRGREVRGSDLDLEVGREEEEEEERKAPSGPRAQARVGELPGLEHVETVGDASPAVASASSSPLPGRPTPIQRRVVDRWRTEAEQILVTLNAARKRVRPSSRGISPSYDNLALIAERLNGGASAEDCLHVVEVCEAECRANPDAFRWFDSVSPFRRENFARKCAADPALASAASGFRASGPASVSDFSGYEDGVDIAEKLRDFT